MRNNRKIWIICLFPVFTIRAQMVVKPYVGGSAGYSINNYNGVLGDIYINGINITPEVGLISAPSGVKISFAPNIDLMRSLKGADYEKAHLQSSYAVMLSPSAMIGISRNIPRSRKRIELSAGIMLKNKVLEYNYWTSFPQADFPVVWKNRTIVYPVQTRYFFGTGSGLMAASVTVNPMYNSSRASGKLQFNSANVSIGWYFTEITGTKNLNYTVLEILNRIKLLMY